MLHKTRGLVLNYIRYRDTSIIVRVYTEDFGIQGYVVNNIRTGRSKGNRIALFQPMSLLHMVVYYQPNRDLHRISEVRPTVPLQHIPFEIVKSSIALFVTEMLGKSLKEESGSPILFRFLVDSVLFLENAPTDFENFHLAFLLQLAFYLGFGPNGATEFEEQLRENAVPFIPDTETIDALNAFLRLPYGTPVRLSRANRHQLLDAIVAYYGVHIDSLGEVRSLAVLREVMG